MDHPGAGSYTIDQGLTKADFQRLRSLWNSLADGLHGDESSAQVTFQDSEAASESMKYGGVERAYFCDAEGWVRKMIRTLLARARSTGVVVSGLEALPYMRFLYYRSAGASMAPHVDLAKKTPGDKTSSTRTFLLYLESCGEGGETLLLEKEGPTMDQCGSILSAVQPQTGRFLAFPHKCPHAGAPVVHAPKLLLRGELY